MLKEDVALADDGEQIVGLAKGRRHLGGKGFIAKLATLVLGHDAHEVRDVEGAEDSVDVELGVDLERLGKALHAGFNALGHADLHTHRVAAVAPTELGLDGLEKVLPFFFVDLEVPVSGDAEGVGSP